VIFARLRLGPLEQPRGHTIVEVITQINSPPYHRIQVRDLLTNKLMEVQDTQLEIRWWEQFNPVNPS